MQARNPDLLALPDRKHVQRLSRCRAAARPGQASPIEVRAAREPAQAIFPTRPPPVAIVLALHGQDPGRPTPRRATDRRRLLARERESPRPGAEGERG